MEYCFQLVATNMKPYFEEYHVNWDRDKFFDSLEHGIAETIWHEGKRVGFYHWRVKNEMGHVNTIQIEEAYRGRGIGRHVLLLLEQLTDRENLDAIRLSVYKTNPAFRLYQALGYQIKSTLQGKHLMVKYVRERR